MELQSYASIPCSFAYRGKPKEKKQPLEPSRGKDPTGSRESAVFSNTYSYY